MNRLIYRILISVIGIMTLAMLPMRAQTVTQLEPEDLPAFGRISLGGDFALELQYGKQFRVQVDVEELYAEFVLMAVEDSTDVDTLLAPQGRVIGALTDSTQHRRSPMEFREQQDVEQKINVVKEKPYQPQRRRRKPQQQQRRR